MCYYPLHLFSSPLRVGIWLKSFFLSQHHCHNHYHCCHCHSAYTHVFLSLTPILCSLEVQQNYLYFRLHSLLCNSLHFSTIRHCLAWQQSAAIIVNLSSRHTSFWLPYVYHPLCYYLNVSNDLLSCSSFYSRSSQYLPLCFFPSLPTTLPLISFRLYRVTVIIGIIILIWFPPFPLLASYLIWSDLTVSTCCKWTTSSSSLKKIYFFWTNNNSDQIKRLVQLPKPLSLCNFCFLLPTFSFLLLLLLNKLIKW